MNFIEERVVTLADMRDAITYSSGDKRKGIVLSNRIMEYFGFEDRIIDNVVDSDTRKNLYDLSESGMFYMDSDVNRLYNGRNWTTFYWGFVKPKIFEFAERYRRGEIKIKKEKIKKNYSIYESLDDEAWSRPRFKGFVYTNL